MPAWLNNFLKPVRRWLTQPDQEVTRWQRSIRWFLELCRHGLHELRHDKAGQMAAALTYHTLFSILPTLVIMLAVIAPLVGDERKDNIKQTAIDYLLEPLKPDEPDASAAPTDNNDQPLVIDPGREETNEQDAKLAEEKRREFREAQAAIEQQFDDLFARLENVSFRGIGAIGLIIFIYGATGLLASIEKSFNLVCGANKARPWYMRLPLYWTVITLGPIFLLGGQAAQEWFKTIIASNPWTSPMVVLSPVLTTWIVLTLMYALLPNTKVKLRAAMIGGFAATLIWMLAIVGLKLFVRNAAASSVYGALFLLPLFLLWLWVTWLIILFGLEVTHAIQAMKGRQFKHMEYRESGDLVVDPSWLLPIAALVARRFRDGRTITAEAICDETGLAQRSVETMVEALEKAELLRHVEDDQQAGYTLGRPAERITAGDVLAVGESLLPDHAEADGDPAWQAVERLKAANHEWADKTTLAEMTD